ncbi:MAG: hypothetical protein WC734_02590 [Patescibacteria group bacterium]
MEVTDDQVGSWMPLAGPGLMATGHSCSECGCVERGLPLPSHCPSCNAAMTIPAAADETAVGRLMGVVLPSLSVTGLFRSAIRPPGMRRDPLTRRPVC